MDTLNQLLERLPHHDVKLRFSPSNDREIVAWVVKRKGGYVAGGLVVEIASCLTEEAACAVLRLQCLG